MAKNVLKSFAANGTEDTMTRKIDYVCLASVSLMLNCAVMILRRVRHRAGRHASTVPQTHARFSSVFLLPKSEALD
jgi:uncharacterized protein YsxB (DUF464 family)